MTHIARKSETLRRILVAAREEFTERGFDAARLENIARATGVTKQLVHHYFPDRDELYSLALSSVSEALLPLFDEEAYEGLSPTDAIRLLVNRIVDLHLEKPSVTMFTLEEGKHRGAHIRDETYFVPLTRAFIRDVVDPLLKRGARNGEFRGGIDAKLFYATVFHVASGCFLMGPAMTRTIGVEFDSAEGIGVWRAHAIDFILASLRADASAPAPRLDRDHLGSNRSKIARNDSKSLE